MIAYEFVCYLLAGMATFGGSSLNSDESVVRSVQAESVAVVWTEDVSRVLGSSAGSIILDILSDISKHDERLHSIVELDYSNDASRSLARLLASIDDEFIDGGVAVVVTETADSSGIDIAFIAQTSRSSDEVSRFADDLVQVLERVGIEPHPLGMRNNQTDSIDRRTDDSPGDATTQTNSTVSRLGQRSGYWALSNGNIVWAPRLSVLESMLDKLSTEEYLEGTLRDNRVFNTVFGNVRQEEDASEAAVHFFISAEMLPVTADFVTILSRHFEMVDSWEDIWNSAYLNGLRGFGGTVFLPRADDQEEHEVFSIDCFLLVSHPRRGLLNAIDGTEPVEFDTPLPYENIGRYVEVSIDGDDFMDEWKSIYSRFSETRADADDDTPRGWISNLAWPDTFLRHGRSLCEFDVMFDQEWGDGRFRRSYFTRHAIRSRYDEGSDEVVAAFIASIATKQFYAHETPIELVKNERADGKLITWMLTEDCLTRYFEDRAREWDELNAQRLERYTSANPERMATPEARRQRIEKYELDKQEKLAELAELTRGTWTLHHDWLFLWPESPEEIEARWRNRLAITRHQQLADLQSHVESLKSREGDLPEPFLVAAIWHQNLRCRLGVRNEFEIAQHEYLFNQSSYPHTLQGDRFDRFVLDYVRVQLLNKIVGRIDSIVACGFDETKGVRLIITSRSGNPQSSESE